MSTRLACSTPRGKWFFLTYREVCANLDALLSGVALLPFAWFVLFFLVPLSFVWLMSFGEKQEIITMTTTGTWANYRHAFEPLYLQIFLKSFYIAGLTTCLTLLIAFPVAMGISFSSPRLQPFLLLLVILPFWTNLLIRTYALIILLRSQGYVNEFLDYLWHKSHAWLVFVGLNGTFWLGERFVPLELLYNNTAVLIGLVYVHLPFMILPLYAVLHSLDKTLVEASLDLGASQWQTFFAIILPLSRSGIVAGVIITFVPALGSFLIPDLLGGTDSQMIANIIERQFKAADNWPFGAALAFILMYLTFFLLALRGVRRKGTLATREKPKTL